MEFARRRSVRHVWLLRDVFHVCVLLEGCSCVVVSPFVLLILFRLFYMYFLGLFRAVVLSIVVLDVVLGSNEIILGRVVADVIIVLFGFVVAAAVPNIMCRLG